MVGQDIERRAKSDYSSPPELCAWKSCWTRCSGALVSAHFMLFDTRFNWPHSFSVAGPVEIALPKSFCGRTLWNLEWKVSADIANGRLSSGNNLLFFRRYRCGGSEKQQGKTHYVPMNSRPKSIVFQIFIHRIYLYFLICRATNDWIAAKCIVYSNNNSVTQKNIKMFNHPTQQRHRTPNK